MQQAGMMHASPLKQIRTQTFKYRLIFFIFVRQLILALYFGTLLSELFCTRSVLEEIS